MMYEYANEEYANEEICMTFYFSDLYTSEDFI